MIRRSRDSFAPNWGDPNMIKSNEPTGLRHWMHRHPLVATSVAVGVLAISIVVCAMSIMPASRTARGAYYYDMTRGELFVAAVGQITPIVRADDDATDATEEAKPTSVRAYVYSCGSCDDDADRRVAWLAMHNPQVVSRTLESHGKESGPITGMTLMVIEDNPQGVLVRLPKEGSPWVTMKSDAGRKLMGEARRCEGGAMATRCEP